MKQNCLRLPVVAFLGCLVTTLTLFADNLPTAAQLEREFANPPIEFRPRTRYWWFGGAVTRRELARELAGMKQQGLGGVEIQSIYDALPAVPDHKPVLYASPEWADRVATCIKEAANLGLKVDLTPGSGWPYAGPWLDNTHAGQGLASQPITLDGPGVRQVTFKPQGPVLAITLRRIGADGPAQMLTNSLSPDGRISISVDEGKWIATCFWAKLGGFGPHKRANRRDTGPVLDHLSAAAMDFHLNHCALPVLDRVGQLGGGTFGSLFIDSWELGRPTWTTDLLQQFRARRSYDLTPYLDLITQKNGSATVTQIQRDYEQTLRDLIAENCYGELTRWSHRHGLLSRAQAHGSPSDWEDSYGMADIPEFEIDFKHPHVPIGADLALAAAHVYGHPLVSCESFTWLTEHWRMTMRDLREEADLIFASGANQLVFHGYSYSPPAAGFPGWDFYASCEIDPNNTFWPYFRPLADYMARNCLLLRSGRPVADVCVYGTESAPQGPNWLSDRVTDHVLAQAARMDGDRLAAGFGRYRVLILDAETTPLETMERIRDFIDGGLTVVAPRLPAEVPTFKDHDAQTAKLRQIVADLFPNKLGHTTRRVGKGTTYLADKSKIPQVLRSLGIEPDLSADGELRVRWLHREGADYDLYLLNNPSADDAVRQTFSFRARGALELWDAHSGKLEPTPYKMDNGRVKADIALGPKESRLVMIRRDKPATGLTAIPSPEAKSTLDINGPWRVEFRHIDGRKSFERDFPTLTDWTQIDDLRHFAGTAIYRGQFRLARTPAGDVFLDLGQVDDVASVIVDGKPAGIVFEEPFRVEVTGLVHTGENDVEIRVANRTENAIAPVVAAWKGPGKWPGYFFVNRAYKTYDAAGADVHRSGLLGPVRLELF
ncbi:MAG TPA: glycosyl hydrolase [Verrucomicrobiae bacterium]|nr:glycosyl hydrolase [Verrucomicrobiae bacterium]